MISHRSFEDGCPDSQHRGIEHPERGHDHLVMLIRHALRDEFFQLGVREHLVNLQAQKTQCRQKVVLFASRLNVMGVGKSQIQGSDQVGVLEDDLQNVVGCKGFCS